MREELALDKTWQQALAILAVPGAVLAALLLRQGARKA